MASFYIVSMYPSIPLEEVREIIMNKAFQNNTPHYRGFNKEQFRHLINLAINDTYFKFNDKLYCQTQGLCIGHPVAATLANAFMCHHEQEWLRECPPDFAPLMYRRYIDDTFAIFREPNHAEKFKEYLNTKHNNIKFTMEGENEGTLPFIGVTVTRDNEGFHTSVYRKPTFTGLLMNFNSYLPHIFKTNLIGTLLYRAHNICSTPRSLNEEINFLKDIFTKNNFPEILIEKRISKFDNKANEPVKMDVPRDQYYLSMPYLGEVSRKIRSRVQQIVGMYYPQLDVRLIFTNNFRIRNLFKLKDTFPDPLRSHIVYTYKCSGCTTAQYVGLTTRHFYTRQCEHEGISERTGRKLGVPKHSAIRDHADSQNNRDCSFKRKNFQILYQKKSNNKDLSILESIHIKMLSPSLNGQQGEELAIF